LAILPGRIIAWIKLRRRAIGPRPHFFLRQRKELLVPSRPPRERVDAIKPEDVIDAKHVEDSLHTAHPPPPPVQVSRSHHVPAIKRNAPVLSPLLRELIVLKVRLRRRAAGPVDRKFAAAR